MASWPPAKEAPSNKLPKSEVHLRRVSDRGREVWEKHSDGIHQLVTKMMSTGAYWRAIQLAATAISKFMRWRCCGLFHGGSVVSDMVVVAAGVVVAVVVVVVVPGIVVIVV